MPSPAEILRELHRLQIHVANLQNEIERGPRMLKAHQTKVAKHEETIQKTHDQIKKLKVAMHSKEVSLKEVQQLVAKHETQRNQASSNKEYQALQHEIENERQKFRKIEDEMLVDMEAIESLTLKVPEYEKEMEKTKQEVAKVVDDIQSRRTSLVDMLDGAHKQIAEVQAQLAPDVKTHYDRLIAARGQDALAAVGGQTCTACYTEITAQSYIDLRRGAFVLCKSCGRILYITEQPAAAAEE